MASRALRCKWLGVRGQGCVKTERFNGKLRVRCSRGMARAVGWGGPEGFAMIHLASIVGGSVGGEVLGGSVGGQTRTGGDEQMK